MYSRGQNWHQKANASSNVVPGRPAAMEFAGSVSLAAVVHVGHYDVSRLMEAEKDAPLADAQAIQAFQRTL